MLTDRFDNPISTTSQTACDLYRVAVDRLLSGQPGLTEGFAAVIEADPGFALGYAGLARAHHFMGDMAEARKAIGTASERLGGATAREQSHVGALGLMMAGKGPQAYQAVRAHLSDHPRDALIAQTSSSIFGLIGFSGQPGREAETLAFLATLLPHYGDDWWILSQYAFSLCETGQLSRAEAVIEKSLALNNENAHGAHVRSHVLYEQGAVADGIAYIDAWLKGYSNKGVMHGHLSWHQALWTLKTGDIDGMWALADKAVTPSGAVASPPLSVVADTASLLHRAELAGVQVSPERWAAISAFCTRFFPTTGNAFVDMHAAVAHAMAGEAAALERIISAPAGPAADLVPDIARGFQHMAKADWASATRYLSRAMTDTARLGGSRAQRDIVEHSLLACLMRQGRTEEAKRLAVLRRPVLAEAVGA